MNVKSSLAGLNGRQNYQVSNNTQRPLGPQSAAALTESSRFITKYIILKEKVVAFFLCNVDL